MQRKVRVGILDHHQSIINGYRFRLAQHPQIEVVGSASYADQLPHLLRHGRKPDVLILAVGTPTSPGNPRPFPMPHVIRSLLQEHGGLNILVISMYAHQALVRAAVDAGASGYIHTEDGAILQDLASVILCVTEGGVFFSPRVRRALVDADGLETKKRLTPRQLEAVSLCAAYPSETTAQIAHRMNVSHSTVRNLLSAAYVRLGVGNRAAAIEQARQLGLLCSPEPVLPT